ncbi:MAG: hypothetical protein P8Z31_10860, partial [Gammaproteobacteria bacterium]
MSAEQIESAIAAIEAREGLSEETRNKVIEQLRDAEAQLQNTKSARDSAAAFAEAIRTAPAETEKLRNQLDEAAPAAPTAVSLGIGESTPLSELEQALSTKLAAITAAEARLADLDTQIATQTDRPARARARINELRNGMDELAASIDLKPPSGEPAMITDARKLAAQLKLDARTAEIKRLDQEIVSNSVRLELTRARRDMTARELANLRRELEVLQSAVNAQRQTRATQALQETSAAELAAAGKHPAVRELAEGNVELTRELPAVAADIERVTSELSQVEEQARSIEQALARSKQRLEVGGVTQATGRLFVEERRNLPRFSQYRAEVRDRRSTLADIGLAQVRIEEQRRELTPLDERIEQVMSEVRDDVTDETEIAEIRNEVELLLRSRRDLLAQVASTYTSYLRSLSDLDVTQQRLLDSAAEYQDFLDQNLLWIPSASPFWLKDVENLGPAIAWALSPKSWSGTFSSLAQAGSYSPLPLAAAILLLGFVFYARRPLATRFKALNRKVGSPLTDHIGLTLGALAISAARALPLPLLLAVLGWAITQSPYHSDFTAAVAASLHTVAPFLYNTLLFRILCAEDGVMQVHFGWSADRLPVIRKQLDRLIVVGVPIIFVAVLCLSAPTPAHRESLGRLAFVVLMFIFSGVGHALLHPRKGVAGPYYTAQPSTWISRLRWFWYALGAGSPLLLALAALFGFLYTAATLTGHLVDTFWLILTIIVVNLVVTRWLALTKRKLAWEMALKEQEAQRAARDEKAASDGSATPVIESMPLDLDAVDQQTTRLVNAGL